jgi:hypothetical protein
LLLAVALVVTPLVVEAVQAVCALVLSLWLVPPLTQLRLVLVQAVRQRAMKAKRTTVQILFLVLSHPLVVVVVETATARSTTVVQVVRAVVQVVLILLALLLWVLLVKVITAV